MRGTLGVGRGHRASGDGVGESVSAGRHLDENNASIGLSADLKACDSSILDAKVKVKIRLDLLLRWDVAFRPFLDTVSAG